MILQILGSSSNGNCYILTADSGERLVIECGVSLRDYKGFRSKKWRDNYLETIDAVLLTHEHQDHARFAITFGGAMIPIYTGAKTRKVLDAQGFARKITRELKPNVKHFIGNWDVTAFEVQHDAPCMAFIIEHPEMGRLAFVTDATSINSPVDKNGKSRHRIFRGINHWLIEANYDREILEYNFLNGYTVERIYNRVPRSHMEIQTAIDTIVEGGVDSVRNVVLLHLSRNNSSRCDFIAHVKEATGCPVYIASPNMEIDLTL